MGQVQAIIDSLEQPTATTSKYSTTKYSKSRYSTTEKKDEEIELQHTSNRLTLTQLEDVLNCRYFEFEYEGTIVNLRLNSINDIDKGNTSEGVTLVNPALKERTLSAEEIAEEQKRETISTMLPDVQ